MRVEFTIDFNLSQEQINEIRKNPLGFAYNHIEVKGFDKNDYNIIRVVNKDIMPYEAYGLDDKIIDWLNKLKIYRIEKISTFTYAQVKSTQIREIRKNNYHCESSYFLPTVVEVMKRRNLNFKDINICDLLPLNEVGISARTRNPLIKRGINYMQDIQLFTKSDIIKSDTFGEKCQKELEEVMKIYGIWYYEYNPAPKNEENFEDDLEISNATHKRLVKIKTDFLKYNLYNFSDKLVDWLKYIGVNYIENLNDYSYEEFRLGDRYRKKNSFDLNYTQIKKLIDKMIECGIDFKDLKAYDLIPISDYELSVRTYNCLNHAGLLYLQDLALFSRSELSKIRNLTVKCLNELDKYLEENGIRYRNE